MSNFTTRQYKRESWNMSHFGFLKKRSTLSSFFLFLSNSDDTSSCIQSQQRLSHTSSSPIHSTSYWTTELHPFKLHALTESVILCKKLVDITLWKISVTAVVANCFRCKMHIKLNVKCTVTVRYANLSRYWMHKLIYEFVILQVFKTTTFNIHIISSCSSAANVYNWPVDRITFSVHWDP